MMIQEMSSGFAEHGHLSGVPALLVSLGSPREEGRAPIPFEHFFASALLGRRLVYLHVRDDSLATAKLAADIHYRLAARGIPCSACVPPGVFLPCDRLAFESVLRVTDGDVHVLDSLDDRIGSVSVHTWPGSPVMSQLTDLPAQHGRYLVLDGDDLGQAKVWLHGVRRAQWRIIRAHPLNDLENAELVEMSSGTHF